MRNTAEMFRDAMRAAGLNPPDVIEADGALHRFPTNGKPGDDAGWYVLHDGRIPAGAFGDWRTGASQTWRADLGRKLTRAEAAAHRALVEAVRRDRELDAARRHGDARERAGAIWRAGQPVEDHPYLQIKGIQSHGLRVHHGALVVPMRDAAGGLHSLQFIGPDGEKRFLLGGMVKGCYFSIGTPDGTLCIAEGYATAASVHEATGHAVAVAFNAGNLEPVARALREKLPSARIVICADQDIGPDRTNTGMTKAREAALAIDGAVALPELDGKRCDFNDVLLAQGPEAVKQAVAAAGRPEIPALDDGVTVALIRGSNLKPEPISWLWKDHLARGKLHMLAGAPGAGKTTIAMEFGATVTAGGCWPDGSRAEPSNVLIWSGEDDPRDTLLPRLIAMGGDPNRVYFVGDVRVADKARSFDPARDMPALEREAARVGDVRLLIVDPIVNVVAGDSHKNSDTRRALQPLVDMAAKLGAALLGVSHFSKSSAGRDPVERVTGSIAFGALPRVVFAAAKSTDDTALRLFVRAKSNIGPDGGGFVYELQQIALPAFPGVVASRVLWGGRLAGTARDLLAEAETGEDRGEGSKIGEVAKWLQGALSEGPVEARKVQRLSEAQGFKLRTLQRARKRIGARASRDGFGKGAKVLWLPPGRIGNRHGPIDDKLARDKNLSPMRDAGIYGQEGATDPGGDGDNPDPGGEAL